MIYTVRYKIVQTKIIIKEKSNSREKKLFEEYNKNNMDFFSRIKKRFQKQPKDCIHNPY